MKGQISAAMIAPLVESAVAICDAMFEGKQPECRTRPSPIFPAESPAVKDGRDHFPIGDVAHGRNALARAAAFTSAPEWYSGSLETFRKKVSAAVHKKFPSIDN